MVIRRFKLIWNLDVNKFSWLKTAVAIVLINSFYLLAQNHHHYLKIILGVVTCTVSQNGEKTNIHFNHQMIS